MSLDCILNPQSEIYENLSRCGIQIIIDNSSFISSHQETIILLKGKIYNRKDLCMMLEIDPNSSTEHVIIHIYKRYGIDYLLQVLDGVFTIILFDYNHQNDISKLFVVKDLFGIIPIYTTTNNKSIAFSTCDPTTIATSSTDMMLSNTSVSIKESFGTYTMYELGSKVSAEWVISKTINRSYFTVPNTIITQSYSSELFILAKCLKRIILKMDDIPDRIADFVVKKLFTMIKNNDTTDVIIHDDTSDEMIHYSPMHFFGLSSYETIFDYDISVRTQLYSSDFLSTTRYPFFDRDFVSLYFSIPLHIRYNHHEELFMIE